jgi:hypothetical protein
MPQKSELNALFSEAGSDKERAGNVSKFIDERKVKVKVKQSHYRPGEVLRFPEV